MIEGKENDVVWRWTNNLELAVVSAEGKAVNVAPHSLHDLSVSALGGNKFYGSFTIVGKDGEVYRHEAKIDTSPTKQQHTEPQYFTWLDEQLDDIPLGKIAGAAAFIMEINQTNTPCSGAGCRPAILQAVANGKVAGFTFPIVVARMSAYQIYEHQYPKVCPTSFEVDHAKGNMMKSFPLESMCLHRFPQHV